MRDCFVFDLDGTLLHTLPDLTDSTNAVMRERGYPEHTQEEILGFIGDGAKRLVFMSMPEYATQEDAEETLLLWKMRYSEMGYPKTKPFDGMVEALQALRAKGVKLGLLSNKFDGPAKENAQMFLPDLLDAVYGERPGVPRKPDPTGLLAIIDELGSVPSRTVYVGDSPVDMKVAKNAGTYALGVSWGYNTVEKLKAAGAEKIIDHPSQLVDLF